MTGLYIAPTGPARVVALGPWYAGDDIERRDEIVNNVRPLLPAALGNALALGFEDRRQAAAAAVTVLTQHGDDLQYGDGDGIDALATVIATLAIQPGGVELLGHHWCLDHAVCAAVEGAA